MTARRSAAALLLLGIGTLAWALAARADDEAVTRTLRRVLGVPEATATVMLERSDPFGGPPDRERGRIWYIPGRGLRYRADGASGIQMGIDRQADQMLLYRPAERKLYRATWAKAPAKLRRLIAEPERVLNGSFGAQAETRVIRGTSRAGWRLRAASLGDSLGKVSAWIAADSKTGLPKFVALGSDVDTLLVEFRAWSLPKSARPADLVIRVPRGTSEEPLDPRGLLDTRGDR